MAFDPAFPISGTTHWDDLYVGLRNNFQALSDLFTLEAWKTEMTPLTYWSDSSYEISFNSISPMIFMTSHPFKYCKDPFGYVHLSGLYIAIAAGADNHPISANLPVGYRPPESKMFLNARAGDGSPSYITISSGGTLFCFTNSESSVIFFDGICFPTT